ncbi:hypothetical protein Celaphus_00006847 [Cervus elaphus hippelaphus]|uniref:Uncharacterized protein n=1 Tax=Cervus elaphus hippelaphus TaxID=46360 RepID=A0A212CY86_CEREH|nr:hypothetical protein Celaphus_00006847 [Cervus elaphus hippelaphus]
MAVLREQFKPVAQSYPVPTKELSSEVLLSNGQKVLANVLTSDQIEYVLESSQEYKIVLRKSYLDSAYDNDVMENRVVLNLLYAQMVADIEGNNSELSLQLRLPGQQLREVSFRVTRMQCWWVISSVPLPNRGTSSLGRGEVCLELAFEYLMSKDQLQWVTITSPQAIMMSICLQSMVDELMVKQSSGSIRKMLHQRSPDASWESMVKLLNKLSAVSLRVIGTPGTDASASDVHGSFAFEDIGDEYL